MEADLKALFLEKVNQEKINDEKKDMIEIKKKKQKKKDIIKPALEDVAEQYYKYEYIDGIKIYDSIIDDKKNRMLQNIQLFELITDENIFDNLLPSILSVNGKLTDVSFNEEEKMPLYKMPNKSFMNIIKKGCNFGEIYVFPNIYQPHKLKSMIKSILKLNGKDILIGCYCQPALDIAHILDLIKKINDSGDMLEILSQYFKPEYLIDHGVKKIRVRKLMKIFDKLINFRITDKASINEVLNIIENIKNPQHIKICGLYIDMIINIITSFTKYARCCKCWKKWQYTSIFNHSTSNEKNKQSKRKKQGTGMYFNSQITFDIYNDINKKINKIKVFRNGSFQIPGIKRPDIKDIIPSLIILRKYWQESYPEKNIYIQYIISNMRNYKCKLLEDGVSIILNKLEDVLHFEKDMKLADLDPKIYIDILEALNLKKKHIISIFKYFPKSLMHISEINNNSEKNPKLFIKLNRPVPHKELQKITIKIPSSGKINLDGANSEIEILEIYKWLNYLFIKYWDEIVYDPKKYITNAISSDSESYESLYSE